MKKTIRPARREDLTDILALQYRAFGQVAETMNNSDLPTLKETEDELAAAYTTGTILKCTIDGRIVGSVRGKADTEGICQIGKLIVDPDCQNQGIGRTLMEAIEEHFQACRTFTLFTASATPNTFALYTKLGYNEVQRESTGSGIEMIHMEKTSRYP